MNNIQRAMVEVSQEVMPQLQIVGVVNGAIKKNGHSAPLMFPSPIHIRRPRAELAVLGWGNRATRLAGRK
jgi:hypothetical protein